MAYRRWHIARSVRNHQAGFTVNINVARPIYLVLVTQFSSSCNYQYGELTEASDSHIEKYYSIEAMTSTIHRAAANQGVLGGFCNAAMFCKAIYGRLPDQLPATLEAVIDGSVKTGLNLTPVKQWNQMAMTHMVKHGQTNASRALPNVLLDRLPEWLREQVQVAESHWLDTFANALELHKAQYWADVEALATEACPPVALFENGRDWLHVGKDLRQAYSRVMRQAVGTNDEDIATSFDAACAASKAFLHQWPSDKQHLILLGAAAYLYAQGPQNGEPVRDALIWQLGEQREEGGREPGIAHMMLDALRQIGLLGDSMWTTSGAVLYYQDEPQPRCSGIPVRLNGVWLNLLNATGKQQYTRMGDVPPAERDLAKARIADFVQDWFRGMMLTTEVTENNRVITPAPLTATCLAMCSVTTS